MKRIYNILPPDPTAAQQAREHWDSIAKPLGSLGLLEDAITRIAAIQNSPDVEIGKRAIVVMCADNGVICEGVSQSDSTVTAICTEAIAGGTANINPLAACYGAEVLTVDIGVKATLSHPNLIDRKLSHGTENIAEGPAMTTAQAQQAIRTGMDIVSDCKKNGFRLIVTGEMGIGNTTTAAAISAVLLGKSPEAVVGRGAGLSTDGLARKIDVLRRAIAVNQPDPQKPVELLAKLGGYDIAGMVGLFLGGAYYRIPIVIDGMISAAAALLAYRIQPEVREYMLASHVSAEPIGSALLDALALSPILTAQMRLGEGTGGAMLLPLLDGALSVYRSAHRFSDTPIERYEKLI
ncbi:MAG: nicotinate-nucleotide--dimethylbenzimidazole phosphoribosyltransferase [Oscillospiraceae bacterium]|nr:nicotinate-nucleotide--dimethylbenzimidazole phosphoribosyltransferase [Oscillospiraceae bacterium]